MAKDLAVILNNGSINSAVVTTLAVQKYRPILVNAEVVKQDPPTRRRGAYDSQLAYFKPFREHTVPVPYLSLTREKLAGGAADPRTAEPVTPALRELVPLIAAAATIAFAYEAKAIYIGLRLGPSTSELAQATEFTQIWSELFQMTLGVPDLELHAPLLELEPWQVIDLGFQVNAPLDKTWVCVDDQTDPCGVCRGCRSRESAFMQAAKPDPLKPRKG
ncbi:MAG: 7-cyano-7-deazaguanine synthase [Tepidisphaeraceae bacterium]